MKGYEKCAHPFWKRSLVGNKVGDYEYIKINWNFNKITSCKDNGGRIWLKAYLKN